MGRIRNCLLIAALSAASGVAALAVRAAPAEPGSPLTRDGAVRPAAESQMLIDRGLNYLKQHQNPDGGWQQKDDPPAITAIAIKAFIQDRRYNAADPMIAKAFAKLLSYKKDDGSIANDMLEAYNTAIAISALAESKDPQYKPALERAIAYLRELQWDDRIQGVTPQMKVDASNPNYGGFGYNKKGKRADLSNTQIAEDALRDAGLKPDDPAFQAALKFATRCQNNSETNDLKFAGDDGGFFYTGADGGQSKAGDLITPDGRKIFRSYGSMTYAGLKSMIYAGLTHDDPRVKAAWNWVTHNWTLDENPGIRFGDPNNPKGSDDGLFYYYHTMARALHAYGEPIITDAKGVRHDWRVEMIQKLSTQQQPDGHWTGVQKWMENKPILSTAYAILALQEAQQDLKEHPAR